MSDNGARNFPYMVSVYEPDDAVGVLIFTFVPKGLQQELGPDGAPKRVPQFIVVARQEAGELKLDWGRTPDDPGAARAAIEAEVATRMRDRAIWIDRVTALVGQAEQWAREMDWSTRRVDKKIDDAVIGKHRVPALLMQADTCRILLEPVGRSAPNAEGVVDLYLMPAYDDIASLYFDGHRWNLHYMFPGAKPVGNIRETAPVPLTKESLERVLGEMKRHAA